MQAFTKVVSRFSRGLDKLAGLGLVVMMGVVVGNVLLRSLFKSPIMGTVDYVGFLATFIIGLALANCSLKNGHVSVDLFIEKMPPWTQHIIDSIMNVFVIYFLTQFVWQMWKYAGSFIVSGEVSATVKMPFYPFVYAVAIGLLILDLTLVVKFVDSVKKAVRK